MSINPKQLVARLTRFGCPPDRAKIIINNLNTNEQNKLLKSDDFAKSLIADTRRFSGKTLPPDLGPKNP